MGKALGGEAEGYVGWRRVAPQCFIPGFGPYFGSIGRFEVFQRQKEANAVGLKIFLSESAR